jgi:hypothetical protein
MKMRTFSMSLGFIENYEVRERTFARWGNAALYKDAGSATEPRSSAATASRRRVMRLPPCLSIGKADIRLDIKSKQVFSDQIEGIGGATFF